MSRYMPITGVECSIPSILIDTQAPLDVLHETADYRIRVATQLLEALSMHESAGGESLILQDASRVVAIVLRDGCDLMDVIKRRLQAQLSI